VCVEVGLARLESSLEREMEKAGMHDGGLPYNNLCLNEASHAANRVRFEPGRSDGSIRAVERLCLIVIAQNGSLGVDDRPMDLPTAQSRVRRPRQTTTPRRL
jgi:hypothetical protein